MVSYDLFCKSYLIYLYLQCVAGVYSILISYFSPYDEFASKILVDECIEDASVRWTSSKIDLHAVKGHNLWLFADTVLEVYNHFKIEERHGKRFAMGRFGQVGTAG